jgi:nicotinate-nucleotide adenylyltransferase
MNANHESLTREPEQTGGKAVRLGLYGGSFDPVHLGHLLVAHAAREEMQLDEVIFVPAGTSPFKTATAPAPAALRLRMLRVALAGLPWCKVSEWETRREGVSYSIDTVQALARERPNTRLLFIMGSDNVDSLGEWREAASLAQLVEFIVIPRPGIRKTAPPPGFTVHSLSGWPLEVASSDIRARVRAGRPFEHLVPAPVAEVIRNNGLYL